MNYRLYKYINDRAIAAIWGMVIVEKEEVVCLNGMGAEWCTSMNTMQLEAMIIKSVPIGNGGKN